MDSHADCFVELVAAADVDISALVLCVIARVVATEFPVVLRFVLLTVANFLLGWLADVIALDIFVITEANKIGATTL